MDRAVEADLVDALGEDEVSMLWNKLLEGMPAYFERLVGAIECGDAAIAATTAHAVKGAALNLGLIALGEAAKTLEFAARNGLQPLAPLYEQLRETERQTAEHIRAG